MGPKADSQPQGVSIYDPVYIEYLAVSNLMTFGVAIVTMFFNGIIRNVTKWLVNNEGQDTKTKEEASAFNKLSVGLVINTVVVPLIVALVLSYGTIDQTWYEVGGVVSSMMTLIVCSYSKDLALAFNVPALLNRYLWARFVYSPNTLRRLWRPLKFRIGESYAYCLVLFALGLIYGPLCALRLRIVMTARAPYAARRCHR